MKRALMTALLGLALAGTTLVAGDENGGQTNSGSEKYKWSNNTDAKITHVDWAVYANSDGTHDLFVSVTFKGYPSTTYGVDLLLESDFVGNYLSYNTQNGTTSAANPPQTVFGSDTVMLQALNLTASTGWSMIIDLKLGSTTDDATPPITVTISP